MSKATVVIRFQCVICLSLQNVSHKCVFCGYLGQKGINKEYQCGILRVILHQVFIYVVKHVHRSVCAFMLIIIA